MTTFAETGLDPQILIALEEQGFETPTPIQARTIPALLEGKTELIALAQTGTGKTAAFGLPLIHLMDGGQEGVQALVLCPTRELCLQITRDLEAFSKHKDNVSVLAVYGGADIRSQMRSLKRGVQIVIGTPGRTLDLIKRKALDLSGLRYWVLDEADEMLNMGFREELDAIEEHTPDQKSTLLFSATMPNETKEIAQQYMLDPEQISVVQKETKSAANIHHEYCIVNNRDRFLALKRIADFHPDIYAIVFCRTRSETKEVADKLMQEGYNADALHGDLSQAQRDQVMKRFRDRSLQLLIATDVAARGLDVNELTHVIHYNLPDEMEVYVHRSGRTGRAGHSGTSIAIMGRKDMRRLGRLEKITGKEFELMKVPSATEVVEKRLFKLVELIKENEWDFEELEDYIPAIDLELSDLSREDLIRAFFGREMQTLFAYYKKASDLNVNADKKESREKKGGKRRDWESVDWVGLKVNTGFRDGLNPGSLMGMVNDATNNRDISFGRIRVMRNFSLFEVPADFASEVSDSLNGHERNGQTIEVVPDTGPKGGGGRNFKGKSKFKGKGGGKGGNGYGFKRRKSKNHRKGGY